VLHVVNAPKNWKSNPNIVSRIVQRVKKFTSPAAKEKISGRYDPRSDEVERIGLGVAKPNLRST
jgi:hypothetical protein